MTPLLVLVTPLLAVLAQAPALPSTADEYRVGAGDVLDVAVLGRDDLSRAPIVQTSGVIWLPEAGDVAVAGLTRSEIEARVVERLAKPVGPARVQVRVKEYQHQFVWVAGEVNRPGRKPLRGSTRLIDVLLEAGGFTASASGEVLVTRLEGAFPDGSQTLRARFAPTPAPTPAEQASLETRLKNGDTVAATPQYYVLVQGEVERPGRYAMDGELTVSRLLSSAGGPTRNGGRKVQVHRLDPRSGQSQILEVDLKAVEQGKQPDLVLLPNDAVSVTPRRVL
jgi:polysaccharide export outer membrane protein